MRGPSDLGLALDAGLSLAILFWPSSDPADEDDRHMQSGPPRWPEAAHPHAIPPAPPRPLRDGATVFGRRG